MVIMQKMIPKCNPSFPMISTYIRYIRKPGFIIKVAKVVSEL